MKSCFSKMIEHKAELGWERVNQTIISSVYCKSDFYRALIPFYQPRLSSFECKRIERKFQPENLEKNECNSMSN